MRERERERETCMNELHVMKTIEKYETELMREREI